MKKRKKKKMMLKFTKDENGDVVLYVNGKSFSSANYLDMVKCVKNRTPIELEDFSDEITQEEQDSIRRMIKEINEIKFSNSQKDENEAEYAHKNPTDVKEDLPF